ncbi:MAG: right-handed parallel beta-helix repeat-containing protein [Sedimentisphaerales bacterium]|nr:right-handed parallel beta-helix repeat-containing protein [Sedimentisphaerales bacterium]
MTAARYAIVLTIAVLCSIAQSQVIYVDDDAPGAGDGTSWAHAYVHLQDALAEAAGSKMPVEIRVAQGLYRPDQGTDRTPGDSAAAFVLLDGVSLRGGFAGVREPDPDVRDIDAYRTILSGDLAGDDGPGFANYADNAEVVVSSISNGQTAVLGGFTITGGSGGSGPGLNCYDSSPLVDRCTFIANMAAGIDGGYGGAVSMSGGAPVLSGCTFTRNWAMSQGGAIRTEKGTYLTLRECTFTANYAEDGGAIRSAAADVNAVDCTFLDNRAGMHGGAFYCHQGKHVLAGCTFASNTARYGGGIYDLFGAMSVARCSFTANDANEGGGVYIDSSAPVALTNCLLTGNRAWDWGGAALVWCDSSPKLSNCTLGDNRAPLGSAIAGGLPVLWNCIVWNQEPTKLPFHVLGDGPLAGYSCIQNGWPGPGNIEADPLFAVPGFWHPNGTPDDPNDDLFVEGDYHLQSLAGRWDPNGETFVVDEAHSRCIDAGDPNSAVATEPFPNGSIINMGVYGSTAQASKSTGGAVTCGTSTYTFVPEQSALVQTGGIAGVHWTYRVQGTFELAIDCETGTASFTRVDANAVDGSPFARMLDPNEVFSMTHLSGSVVGAETIRLSGEAADGSSVVMTLTFKGDSVGLFAETIPPPNSADFFLFALEAVARRVDDDKEAALVK